jgi:glutamine amidotransferase
MTVAIIDYGSSNLRSAFKAFELAAENAGLKTKIVVTNNPTDLKQANQIILPGVGAFADCRKGLAELDGMEKAIEEHVIVKKKPFLGICVGMQLMATIGREHKDTSGLDWLPGEVVAIEPSRAELKIPHMGWNNLTLQSPEHPLLKDLGNNPHFYFVHSYVFKPKENSDIIATFDYGGQFTAIIGRDNIVGTQFHPEKSQVNGLLLISNFLKW